MKSKHILILLILIAALSSCTTQKTVYTVRWVDSDGVSIGTDYLEGVNKESLYNDCLENFQRGFDQPSNFRKSLNQAKIYLELYGSDPDAAFILKTGLLSSLYLYIKDSDLFEYTYKFRKDYIRMGYLREYQSLMRKNPAHLSGYPFYSKVDKIIDSGFWHTEAMIELLTIFYRNIKFLPDKGKMITDMAPAAGDLQRLADSAENWRDETGFLILLEE